MKQLLIFFLSIAMLSCGNNRSHKKPDTNIHKTPKASQEQAYLFYSPENLKLNNALFVVIDAHGDARLALNKLRWSAKTYGFQMIALKNVKNNDPNFEQHISVALQQAQSHLKPSPDKIFYLGFSGGARMAMLYAQKHGASGVVMLGAGPSAKQSVQFPFPLAMISGMRDFNFAEQYYDLNSPQLDNPDLITLHQEGKHEWPDSLHINEAVTFVLVRSGEISPADIDFDVPLKLAAAYKEKKNLFLYFKQLEFIAKTADGDMRQTALQSLDDIRNSAKAQAYFKELGNTIIAAQKRNQYYVSYLDEKPLDWWEKEIDKLNGFIENKQGMYADSYARNKAFLGILLYSRCNAALAGRANAKLLPKYFRIYQMLEPENPDLYYFKARYAYNLGQTEEAIKELRKAINYGFKDEAQLHSTFPQMIITAAKNN